MTARRPDLLLVHPGHRTRIYQSLGTELSGVEPPVWAAMIATFIRNQGHSVVILDAEAENLDIESTVSRVQDINPILTAIVVYGHQPSASTQNMTASGEICTQLKNEGVDTKTLLLGGHVASLPRQTLLDEDADFVASGEGPFTVLDLLGVLKAGDSDLSKVRGLWWLDDNRARSNAPAPLITDLDKDIPELAWDLLPMSKYRAHNWHCFGDLKRQPYGAINTTLGCPYHCTFCCIQAPFKEGEEVIGMKPSVNSYRFWSPESVISQIDTLVENYGVRNLRISDELFVLNRNHVHAICDLIIDRGYDLNIWAYTRVDSVGTSETISKLKQAGVNWLCYGIEAADDNVRNDVKKGFEQNLLFDSIKQVNSEGIYVIANYIFGLPEEDIPAMQRTLDLALELNCEFANFYCAMAYPGSQLYLQAKENSWPLPEKWSGFSQHSVDTLPLPTNYLSSSEVLRFRDSAWQTYYENPGYLEMINQKFGPETVSHIKEMASHKLIRNHA